MVRMRNNLSSRRKGYHFYSVRRSCTHFLLPCLYGAPLPVLPPPLLLQCMLGAMRPIRRCISTSPTMTSYVTATYTAHAASSCCTCKGGSIWIIFPRLLLFVSHSFYALCCFMVCHGLVKVTPHLQTAVPIN